MADFDEPADGPGLVHRLWDEKAALYNKPWQQPQNYELRQNIKFDDSVFDACGPDEDATDDYDPSLKHEVVDFAPARKGIAWNLNSLGRRRAATVRREKINSWRTGRCRGLISHIVLRMPEVTAERLSNDHFARVAILLRTWQDNWPESDGSGSESNFTDLTIDSIQQRRLRARNAQVASCNGHGHSHGPSKTPAPDLWESVQLGDPAYRGCKACANIGVRCDLVDGAEYPCTHCVEDDLSCELILEPLRKAACEACRRRRVRCSFSAKDSEHRGRCEECSKRDTNCVAGPRSGFTRQGPSLDAHFGV